MRTTSELETTMPPDTSVAAATVKRDQGATAFLSQVFSFPAVLGAILVGAVFVGARAL